jgi:hypothetical protein
VETPNCSTPGVTPFASTVGNPPSAALMLPGLDFVMA